MLHFWDDLEKRLRALKDCSEKKDAKEYEKICHKLFSKYKKHSDYLAKISSFLMDANQPGLSIMFFDQLIELDPKTPYNYSLKADALLKLGENAKAFRYYDLAIGMESHNELTLLAKADALYTIGLDEESILICEKVLKDNPTHPYALSRKATSLTKLGKDDEAFEIAKKVLKIEPNNSIAKKLESIISSRTLDN